MLNISEFLDLPPPPSPTASGSQHPELNDVPSGPRPPPDAPVPGALHSTDPPLSRDGGQVNWTDFLQHHGFGPPTTQSILAAH